MTTLSFEQRLADSFGRMRPAEQRVAQYFQGNPEEVLIASAAGLAARAGTSDATVVRTVRALGFSGLEELRRTLAQELRDTLSLPDRLSRTLNEAGGSVAMAFDQTLDIHFRSLEKLRRAITPELFERAVEGIAGARRTLVFGLGPSSAIATYLAIQLGRFGLEAAAFTNSGLLFADDLQKLRDGDLVIILAYGRVYAELVTLLDEIESRRLRSFLITDTLAARLRSRVELVLPVARGRADMLSMHTATLGFVETLLVGICVKRPEATLAGLTKLDEARAKLAGNKAALASGENSGPRKI